VKNRLSAMLGALLVLVLLMVPMIASAGQMRLLMAGGSVGGTGLLAGSAWAEKIKLAYPGSIIDVVPGGTVTNIMRLGNGDIDIGWATTTTMKEAFEGNTAQFPNPLSDLRGIARLWNQQYQFIVSEGFPASTVDEVFQGKMPIRFCPGGPRGHIGVLATEQLLEKVYGITFRDIEDWGGQIIYTEFSEAVQLMRDGHINVFSPLTAAPNSTIMELTSLANVKFLSLEQDSIDKMEELGYVGVDLKAGTYRGMNEDVRTISAPFGIGVTADLSDDDVYRITKVLCDSRDHLASVHVILEQYDPPTSFIGLGIPLHPGAEKYYREQGWLQ
jgi:TRAP transporter TAXI family solute receptor